MCAVSNSAGVRTSRIHSGVSDPMRSRSSVEVMAAVMITPAIGVRLIKGYPRRTVAERLSIDVSLAAG